MDSRFALNQFSLSLGGLPFPLLADFHPKGHVAGLYGIWNEERGTSRRAVFVIDKDGTLRWAKVYPAGIPDNSEILAELARLPG